MLASAAAIATSTSIYPTHCSTLNSLIYDFMLGMYIERESTITSKALNKPNTNKRNVI